MSNPYEEPTDPYEDEDRLQKFYAQGYCYDCGEKDCTDDH